MIEERLADLKLASHQRNQGGRAREGASSLARDGSVGCIGFGGVGPIRLPSLELSRRRWRVTLSDDRLFADAPHSTLLSSDILRSVSGTIVSACKV